MTSLSKDTTNRLEQLPSELLEKILLEVVSEVMPPTSSRANEEMKSSQTLASKFLAHRLISRPFCNHSWRALAKVIGETVFELCSRGSFENLVAVSQCKKLIPWLNKLTFSTTYPMEKHPTAEDDGQKKLSITDTVGPTLCRELMRINNDDATWYPKVWQVDVPIASAPPGSKLQYAELQQHPKTISTYCFRIPSTTVSIAQMTQRVSMLHLRNIWSLYAGARFPTALVNFQSVFITKQLFPALRTSILDIGSDKTRTTPNTEFPLQSDFPNLSRIITINTKLNDTTLIAFIDLFKGSFRMVTFQDIRASTGSCRSMFELLQHLHIDRLDIVNLQEKSWIPDNQLILGLTEGLLYGAAKEVVIRPPKDADRLAKFFTTLIESRETKNQNS
ncbi:hypothetical protein PTMSG1_07953 [Pyrenophora teres f. maculata]|nr:hypothetical protein PTMSG1_07953 [Pyrenophora teres f. maculata]